MSAIDEQSLERQLSLLFESSPYWYSHLYYQTDFKRTEEAKIVKKHTDLFFDAEVRKAFPGWAGVKITLHDQDSSVMVVFWTFSAPIIPESLSAMLCRKLGMRVKARMSNALGKDAAENSPQRYYQRNTWTIACSTDPWSKPTSITRHDGLTAVREKFKRGELYQIKLSLLAKPDALTIVCPVLDLHELEVPKENSLAIWSVAVCGLIYIFRRKSFVLIGNRWRGLWI